MLRSSIVRPELSGDLPSLWSQHRLLRFVVDGDKVVVRGLGLWVMTIVFLPFPTALVAAPSQDLGTRALYIGTMEPVLRAWRWSRGVWSATRR